MLLAADLDRTILPNGSVPEPPNARTAFSAFVSKPSVTLAYVSGRSKALLKEAVLEFQIPLPDYAIGDVGTTIFQPKEEWSVLTNWSKEIAPDWQGKTADDLHALLADLPELTRQESEKQNTWKLSYYAPEDTNRDALLAKVHERLEQVSVQTSLIWSIDEPAHTGLLDVLPARANKHHALEFLRAFLSIPPDETIFCGDSGNDLQALTGGFKAVLVGNARQEIKEETERIMATKGKSNLLFIAQKPYSAGVLEGVHHFFHMVP